MTQTIILVHGACHGAWCWDRVVPLLKQIGYEVLAPELPGRAGDGRAGWRMTLSDYAAAIIELAKQQSGPVIALGHSMGGLVIAAAAEKAPELFERLVFLSAFLPVSGDSLVSLGAQDKECELAGAVSISWLKGLVTINSNRLHHVYCGDCSDTDLAWVQSRIVPESLRPSLEKVILTKARFQSVPRSFIRCAQDRALSIQMQERMIERQPCQHVATLQASHSPFMSMPEKLATAIKAVI